MFAAHLHNTFCESSCELPSALQAGLATLSSPIVAVHRPLRTSQMMHERLLRDARESPDQVAAKQVALKEVVIDESHKQQECRK